MKDDTKVIRIDGLGELNSKICSFIIHDDKGDKKTKGINKNVVKKIYLEEYVDLLYMK